MARAPLFLGALVLVIGCAPVPSVEGKTCAAAADCPAPLACSRGVCTSLCAEGGPYQGVVGVPRCGAWLGAYPSNATTWANELQSLESSLGRKLDLVRDFRDMDQPFPADVQLSAADGGHLLSLSMAARSFNAGTTYAFADVAAGSRDTFLDQAARRVASLAPQTVFLDFQPDAEDLLGSGAGGQGTAADYRAAFRHVRARMTAAGATNIAWVWHVKGTPELEATYLTLYPGDDVVDWVAFETVNPYRCISSTASWLEPEQLISPFLGWVAGQSFKDKPVMLPYVASAEDPEDATRKQAWVSGLAQTLETSFPSVKAVVMHSSGGPGSPSAAGCDYTIDSSPNALRGMEDALGAAYFTPPELAP